MGMPLQQTNWSAEMARALPDDGKRYEVLDGELVVSPAPTFDHQRVVFALARVLDDYVRAWHIGEVFIAPTDVEFSPRRLLQPDVFVIPTTPGRKVRTFQEGGRLLLAAEVLSPATARVARTRKRDVFKDERVPDYWIVDADARVIERWTPDGDRPIIVSTTISWQPAPPVPPFVLNLEEFFAQTLD